MVLVCALHTQPSASCMLCASHLPVLPHSHLFPLAAGAGGGGEGGSGAAGAAGGGGDEGGGGAGERFDGDGCG
ncbi:unnamed protein product [Closterium sp. Yama58-4]|nr:unnamed protein product [Closterium sp. Yama58-4]